MLFILFWAHSPSPHKHLRVSVHLRARRDRSKSTLLKLDKHFVCPDSPLFHTTPFQPIGARPDVSISLGRLLPFVTIWFTLLFNSSCCILGIINSYDHTWNPYIFIFFLSKQIDSWWICVQNSIVLLGKSYVRAHICGNSGVWYRNP